MDFTKKETGEEFEILLPLKSDWRDFAIRMIDTIHTLALFENRSQLSIKANTEYLNQVRLAPSTHDIISAAKSPNKYILNFDS